MWLKDLPAIGKAKERGSNVTDPSTLQILAWIATSVGSIVASIALLLTAWQVHLNVKANKESGRVQRAAFWLELRKMFASHDEVHKNFYLGAPGVTQLQSPV